MPHRPDHGGTLARDGSVPPQSRGERSRHQRSQQKRRNRRSPSLHAPALAGVAGRLGVQVPHPTAAAGLRPLPARQVVAEDRPHPARTAMRHGRGPRGARAALGPRQDGQQRSTAVPSGRSEPQVVRAQEASQATVPYMACKRSPHFVSAPVWSKLTDVLRPIRRLAPLIAGDQLPSTGRDRPAGWPI
jgi:hypothetical protein